MRTWDLLLTAEWLNHSATHSTHPPPNVPSANLISRCHQYRDLSVPFPQNVGLSFHSFKLGTSLLIFVWWAWLTTGPRLLINIHREGVSASDEASVTGRAACCVQQSERDGAEARETVCVDVEHQLVLRLRRVRHSEKHEWEGFVLRGDAAESCWSCQSSVVRYVCFNWACML